LLRKTNNNRLKRLLFVVKSKIYCDTVTVVALSSEALTATAAAAATAAVAAATVADTPPTAAPVAAVTLPAVAPAPVAAPVVAPAPAPVVPPVAPVAVPSTAAEAIPLKANIASSAIAVFFMSYLLGNKININIAHNSFEPCYHKHF
jgi:hypothetical protein